MALAPKGFVRRVPYGQPDEQNVFKNLRQHIGKVCRWRASTDQADRWLASGLILASEGFNRIAGNESLPELVTALERKYEDARREETQTKEKAA